jgi:acyl-CoA thioesterase FadM
VTPGDIRKLDRVLSAVAPTAQFDRNEHLSVAGHFALHLEAATTAMEAVGLTDEFVNVRGLGFFVVKHELHYLAEITHGQTVSAYADFSLRLGKAVRYTVYLLNDTTDELASTCLTVALHVDQHTRKSSEIPIDLRTRIDAAIAMSRTWTRSDES